MAWSLPEYFELLIYFRCKFAINASFFSGIHHKKNNCESAGIISKVQQILKAAKRHLYPDKLTLTFSTTLAKNKLRKGNGGWGDIRDHKLCAGLTIQL